MCSTHRAPAPGEVLLVHNLLRLIRGGMGFSELVVRAEKLATDMKTFFVLQSLDNLVKTGRINRLVGAAGVYFTHAAYSWARTVRAASCCLKRYAARRTPCAGWASWSLKTARHAAVSTPERDTVVIAHCNCPDRAQELKKAILRGSKVIRDV